MTCRRPGKPREASADQGPVCRRKVRERDNREGNSEAQEDKPPISDVVSPFPLFDRQEQGGENQDQGILENRIEGCRCDERIEDAADHTADGKPEIKFGQMPGRRSRSGNLSMTDHTGEKEGHEMNDEHRPFRDIDIGEIHEDQDGDRDGQEQNHHSVDHGRNPGKDDDERKQVESERDDPEERDCGDVRTEEGSYPEHQARRHKGIEDPAAPLLVRKPGIIGAACCCRILFIFSALRPVDRRVLHRDACAQYGEGQDDEISDGP